MIQVGIYLLLGVIWMVFFEHLNLKVKSSPLNPTDRVVGVIIFPIMIPVFIVSLIYHLYKNFKK